MTLLILCLSLATFGGVAALALYYIGRTQQEIMATRLRIVTGLLQSGGFPLNAAALGSIRNAVDTDLLVVTEDGQTLSTLPPERHKLVAPLLQALDPQRTPTGELDRALLKPHGFHLIYKFGESGKFTLAALLPSAQALDREKREAVFAVLQTGAAGIALLALLSFYLGNAITRPLRLLSAQTEKVAAGNLDEEVSIDSRDEIGNLAARFNQMVKSLKETQERMVHTEKMAALGQLATGVAHEIKNPLASIRMTAQLLQRRLAETPNAKALDNILEEIDKLQAYIQDLLAYARPEETRPQRVNLNDLAREVVQFTDKQCRHVGVTVRTDFDGAAPDSLLDPARIKQAALNLLLNAVQASPRGGEVTLATRFLPAQKQLQLLVTDRGAGVPPELRDKIFAPFFTTKEGGTGLGLAVCNSIAVQHGGALRFDSRPGDTRFWIELPVRVVQE